MKLIVVYKTLPMTFRQQLAEEQFPQMLNDFIARCEAKEREEARNEEKKDAETELFLE